MKLFSDTISTLENAINYSNTKQKVIAQNIANVDTPNYKAKDVTFKESLSNAIEATKTDTRHIDFTGTTKTGSSSIVTKSNSVYNNSGNSVDVDKEMTELATNQIYYNALIDRISGKFTSLENVIKGGR
ncbi:flagellar basal body rod protein FlgB [Niallia nealsonii]|uniref:Flagellar basal body rod protein FlgB n=1 Tax=Niallia nealsonii TaxID=115979 RepID=A0A2N0Z6N0_9BACI|nr:flagellar basal body rod protein FlgB [Niallia nealsonii]PKG25175.1 flagellar basal body rod protein FlgB [Niallia nealsonii]